MGVGGEVTPGGLCAMRCVDGVGAHCRSMSMGS